jgi:hypothetical protein
VDVAISAVARPGEQHRRNHDVIDTSDIDVYLGLDVGKGEHHATAKRLAPPARALAPDGGVGERLGEEGPADRR